MIFKLDLLYANHANTNILCYNRVQLHKKIYKRKVVH